MHNFIVKHSRFKFRYLHVIMLFFIFNRFRKALFGIFSRSVLNLYIKKVKALFVRVLLGFYIHSFTSNKELDIINTALASCSI